MTKVIKIKNILELNRDELISYYDEVEKFLPSIQHLMNEVHKIQPEVTRLQYEPITTNWRKLKELLTAFEDDIQNDIKENDYQKRKMRKT